MISSMYQRRMKAAFITSGVVFLIGGAAVLIDKPDSSDEWLKMLGIGLTSLFLLIIALVSWKQYMTVKDIHIPVTNTSIFDVDHLVLKKEVGLVPALLLFEKSGHFIGKIRPLRIPVWLYPLGLLLRDSFITMLPITYGLWSTKGKVLITFQRKGIWQARVTVKNAEGQNIGEYVQDDLKSMVAIKGLLKDEDGNTILPVRIKGLSGDFSLTDEAGRRWAYFDNGFFPHEYTNLFRDVKNDIVHLSHDLSENQKGLLLAMIGFIFLERSK